MCDSGFSCTPVASIFVISLGVFWVQMCPAVRTNTTPLRLLCLPSHRDMLLYLCPLSSSTEIVSVRSLLSYRRSKTSATLVQHQTSSDSTLCGQHETLTQLLDLCWPTVYDAEPTLAQYWATVSCLVQR